MRRSIYIFAVAAIGLVAAGTVLAYTSPGRPTGYVNDFANIIAPSDRAAIEAKLSGFEKQTGVEIAVATVPSLGGDTIDDYAVKLFADWGIGKKQADNGLLILVAPTEREARIEVGYGLEPTVTDAASSVIVRNVMIPAFARGDYAAGISGAADMIIGLIQNDPEAARTVAAAIASDASGTAATGQSDQAAPRSTSIFVPVLIAVILVILLSTRGGRRILFYMLLSGMFRGGRNGKDGFGGSGGGFGGFGGGRSGGGGASGGW